MLSNRGIHLSDRLTLCFMCLPLAKHKEGVFFLPWPESYAYHCKVRTQFCPFTWLFLKRACAFPSSPLISTFQRFSFGLTLQCSHISRDCRMHTWGQNSIFAWFHDWAQDDKQKVKNGWEQQFSLSLTWKIRLPKILWFQSKLCVFDVPNKWKNRWFRLPGDFLPENS